MKPTAEQLLQSLDVLKSAIELCGDNEIGLQNKMAMAETTALLVERIRRKYDITSFFYAPAEAKAERMYKERFEK